MLPTDLPELAIVRVLTPGGPYAAGDVLSVAFAVPTIGRLVAHAGLDVRAHDAFPMLVPETISACVMHAAPPYAQGDILTLSFVDPRVARIHPTAERPHVVDDDVIGAVRTLGARTNDSVPQPFDPIPIASAAHGEAHRGPMLTADDRAPHHHETAEIGEAPPSGTSAEHTIPLEALGFATYGADELPEHARPPAEELQSAEPATAPIAPDTTPAHTYDAPNVDHASYSRTVSFAPHPTRGVRVLLQWKPERVRRFVQVVDKLFTIDRLGWYRHAFAMRLLVPDEISCGDPVADVEAMRHLVCLRAAAVETLGRPLLGAFMPNFSVTPEWLDTLDNPASARALAGLRDAIAPYLEDDNAPLVRHDTFETTGHIARTLVADQPASTVESILPIFIATESPHVALAERLREYRRTLLDAFGQTASSSHAVRLNAMAQPNHSLDDRLWQLVGVVGESLGGLAVASKA